MDWAVGTAVIGGAAAISVGVLHLTNGEQPQPYMDEIFHCRQAQQYCACNYSVWDGMITTLPGLYMVSVAAFEAVVAASGREMGALCSVFNLRLTNCVLWLACLLVVQRLVARLQHIAEAEAWVHAVVICFFPLLFFFSSLYYTDVGSVFFVLCCCFFAETERTGLSALSGVLAVCFRQTNIVWVGFAAGTLVLRRLGVYPQLPLPSALASAFNKAMSQKLSLTRTLAPYLGTCALFAGFLFINDGIVVGDRTNHSSVAHFPQLLYFSAFTLAFGWPLLLPAAYTCIVTPRTWLHWQTIVGLFATAALAYLAVDNYTMTHPYLLADNRHYTFYLWKNIFRRFESANHLAIPVYVAALALMKTRVSQRGSLWWLLFLASTALTIVPAKLIEFRYFLVPFLLFRLNVPASTRLQLAVEALFYAVINTVTLYLYLYRPFEWAHESGQQRFMW
jgi:alpha-1,2-glucosyltransferase